VTTLKAICCLALFCLLVGATPALAEVTGQQRAQQAGRAILGRRASAHAQHHRWRRDRSGSLYGKKAAVSEVLGNLVRALPATNAAFRARLRNGGSGSGVIAVDVGFNDSIEAIRAYRKKLGITMPIVFDDGSLGQPSISGSRPRTSSSDVTAGYGTLAISPTRSSRRPWRERRAAVHAPDAGGTHGAATAHKVVAHDDLPPIGVGDLLPKRSLHTLDGQRFEFQHGAAQHELTVLVFCRRGASPTSRPHGRRFPQPAAAPASSSALWRLIPACAGSESHPVLGERRRLAAVSSRVQGDHTLTLDASGEVFRAFRVNDVPTVLIADTDGRVVRRIEGSATQDASALRTAINGL